MVIIMSHIISFLMHSLQTPHLLLMITQSINLIIRTKLCKLRFTFLATINVLGLPPGCFENCSSKKWGLCQQRCCFFSLSMSFSTTLGISGIMFSGYLSIPSPQSHKCDNSVTPWGEFLQSWQKNVHVARWNYLILAVKDHSNLIKQVA